MADNAPTKVVAGGPRKRIILVRHAESTENVKIGEVKSGWDRLTSFQGLPTANELWSGVRMLEFDTDSQLSDLGRRQLTDQQSRMAESSFVESAGIELVVHSPLQRARQTCHAIFGSIIKGENAVPVLMHEDLRECKPVEHVYTAPFQARIDRFTAWLASRDEMTIALVGHGQHFKRMLRLESKFYNVDVWEATFNSTKQAFVGEPTMLFRTPLARASEAQT